tara:strand:- start:13030 stop:13386 length:357 start_codon:yes stop_codon:yes gene_type:complete
MLGLHERKDNYRLRKLLGFNPAKTAWCAGFINALLRDRRAKGTGKLLARSFLKIGRKVKNPQQGDIVVLKRGVLPWQGHVGLYAGETPTHIQVLGGNQDNQVSLKLYPKKRVLGYRRL